MARWLLLYADSISIILIADRNRHVQGFLVREMMKEGYSNWQKIIERF